jgi:hypothetical protein
MKKILFIVLLLGLSVPMMAQVTVQGTVRSSSDQATLPGVSILVKGTTNGTVTDLRGHNNKCCFSSSKYGPQPSGCGWIRG